MEWSNKDKVKGNALDRRRSLGRQLATAPSLLSIYLRLSREEKKARANGCGCFESEVKTDSRPEPAWASMGRELLRDLQSALMQDLRGRYPYASSQKSVFKGNTPAGFVSPLLLASTSQFRLIQVINDQKVQCAGI